MAAMVTTFGVGELSAINGQAGSFAEYGLFMETCKGTKLCTNML